MNFETLNNKGFKKLAIVITVSIFLFSVLILSLSLAKYRSTNSINIAKGTIKYNRPDLHLAEVYVVNDAGEYELTSEVPENGYILNKDTTKTRCENKDGTIVNIIITYENRGLTFSKLVTGGVKCYAYFDKKPSAADKIPDGNPTNDKMFAGITGDGIYTWTKGDYSGGDQPIKYYRGNVNNNWVVFGKDGSNYIWWRIIRNNSNGSLRMIYAGTSRSKTSAPATTGSGTGIGTSVFNTNFKDNAYVGFKYMLNHSHGKSTNSTILNQLEVWYNRTIGINSDYSNKIDTDAGFCNDRTPNSGPGIGKTDTFYAAYTRLITNKVPTLLCINVDDIFKTNVGLITADEVNMGGMVYGDNGNTSTYLYTGEYYWTMSPHSYLEGDSYEFYVHNSGYFNWDYIRGSVTNTYGVRPVVNLKSDVKFVSGNGEASTPFVVEGT